MMPTKPGSATSRGFLVPIGGAEGRRKSSLIMKRYVALCGGKDARILVIPTASLLAETGPEYVKLFEQYGARAVNMPVEKREDCFDELLLEKLEAANGIFITGGNQLRLSTILGGTPVARAIRRRNAEGVHLAGTSAGAAIMSEHMIAGGRSGPSPRESGVELAPGLGLTNRVIIDQHFSQRGRMGRLLSALSFNPFVCGLGIDENTAGFIDADGSMEVVGRGTITVVDPGGLTYSSMSHVRKAEAITLINLKLHVLSNGAAFDLENRTATPPALPERPAKPGGSDDA